MTHPSSSAARTPRSLSRAAALAAAAIVAALSGWHTSASTPQQVGTWASFGTVADSRSGAAAVALPDGRTLILGGVASDGTTTDSVVVLDPASKSVGQAGRMMEARAGHTATLLKDGRVLIAGGIVNGLVSADIELFDPVAGTSVLAGSMVQPRTRHAAALVGDGKVLIAGGVTADGVVLDQAEIADGATGGSIPTGSPMLTARAGASATTLIEGHVLIAGGENSSGKLRSAELFEPWTGSFIAVDTELSVARSGHSALLLPHNGGVLISGGTSASAAVAASDLFLPAVFPDPYSFGMGAFAPTGELTVARTGAISGPAGDDGHVFVAGGGTTEAERYRYATIKTDKDDYAPGVRAVITGSGWESLETVTLRFQEDPAVHEDYLLTVKADAEGNIYWDQWAPKEHDLNVRFYLMASGSRSRAQTTFTDARNWFLTFSGTGSGSVKITPSTGTVNAPVSCGGTGAPAASQTVTSTCSTNITTSDNLAVVTFSATAASGSTFAGWPSSTGLTSSTCSGTTNPCSAVITSSGALTVAFSTATNTNTTTTAASATATYGAASVTLNASVAPASGPAVGAGTVTFTVKNGATTIGTVTSGTVVAGAATASFPLTGVNAGTYTIQAAYNAGTGFNPSNNSAQSPAPTLTVAAASQTITITQNAPVSASYNTSFDVKATGGGSTNAVTFVAVAGSVCTVGTVTNAGGTFTAPVTMTSGTGTCQLALNQAADTNYSAATQVLSATTTAAKANQTISFAALAGKTFGDPDFGVSATATSGLTVSFAASGNCTVTGATVHLTGAGTCTITASQAGNGNYNAATDVPQAFSIAKAASTTTVTVANATYDGNPHGGTASVTGFGGLNQTLTVSYQGRNGTVYPLSTTAPTNAGDYTASASFAGDANHNPSNDSQPYSIAKANQTISFGALAGKTFGDPDFGVSATATSGLTVSFAASGSCTVTGSTVHLTGAGSCTITASQAGNGNFNAATDVPQSFAIAKAASTTTVTVANATYDGNPHGGTASVTGFGGLNQTLTVSYQGRNGTVYPLSTTAPTNAGDYTASASFAGDANHNPSNDSQPYSIAKANQTISFGALAGKTFGDPDFGVSATATSGLTVSFAASGNCTVSGSTVHLTGAGSCTITASQAGNGNYNAATDVPQAFSIAKAASTTTVTVANATYDGNPHGGTASVTGFGGLNQTLTVSYQGRNGTVYPLSTTAPTNAGDYTASASFAGDTDHHASNDSQPYSIAKANQTISFGALAGKTFGDSDFGVSATATSGLAVSFAASGNCTVTGSTVHLTGAGSCTITASQAGNGNFNAATDVPQSFAIGKAASTTTVTVANATYDGNPHGGTASVTGFGGLNQTLTVNYEGRNGTAYPLSTTAPTNAGDYTASASFAGDANHNPSNDSQPYSIAKANQTISFGALAGKTFGDPDFGVSATATSGLAVSFAASGNCTVTGGTVHLTGAGSCTVTASQAGNGNYNAATDVPQAFSIAKAASTTTVTVANATYDGNPHGGTASVTGFGGLNQALTVSYQGRNGTVYPLSTTAPTNAGDYTASASFAGDTDHHASNDSKDYSIAKANQTISFGALAGKTFGDPDFGVSATATSGLAVSFAASGNCTVSGSTVHLTGAGSCTITASQAGDGNFNAATDVPQSFAIGKAASTTTVTVGNATYDGSPHGGTASVTGFGGLNQALTVSYEGRNGTLYPSSTTAPTNAGDYTASASFAGDTDHDASNDSQPSSIAKADQTISFGALAGKTFGDPDFGVSATATSGLAVSFAASGNCTVSGSTVHLTGAGSCTITASQTGDGNFNAAADVPQTFAIGKAASTTTVTVANATYDGNPHGGTASATGAGGLNQSLTVSYEGRNGTVYPLSTTAPTNAGDYTASASFAGDTDHNPSNDSKDYSLAKANQTIAFGALAGRTFGDADFGVSATATSGLAVSFAATGNCTITGTTVHLTGAGSCTVTASQTGNANYHATTDVPQTFAIAKAASTTTVTAANATYDGNPHGGTASVTGFAGLSQTLTVSYQGRNGTVYPLSTTAPTNAGDYTASASFAGDTDHHASNDSKDYSIAKANQTIAFGPLGTKLFGDADFSVGATASSGLAVSFAAGGHCTVSGNTVHLTGSGNCTITASQTGNGNHNSAPDVPRTFAITAWTLSGFHQPVDPTTTSTVVWNTVKGGSTVPLKFNIYAGSVEQTAVSAVKLMTATQVSCNASSSVEAVITELGSTGGTSLRYDGTGHQFIQNWQTPKSAGVCFRVTMTALDGSTIDNAFFKIK